MISIGSILSPAIAAACFVSVTGTSTAEPVVSRFPGGAVQIVAHRGYNKEAPENTCAAAELCIANGVDWVEADIRRSRDGVHVIIHDSTLDRTTNGTGRVSEYDWEHLSRLDAGSWFGPAFRAERIPRLEAFLDRFGPRIKIYLDIKDADIQAVATMVRERGLEDRVFLWSGDRSLAERIRDLDPRLPFKVNVRDPSEVGSAASGSGAAIVEFSPEAATPAMIETCREHGVLSMMYTKAPDEGAFATAVRLGIDLVNIDHPGLFLDTERRTVLGDAAMHAHNDYEHERPLLDALDAGAASVEADVFLVGDEVLVAHDRKDTRADRTFRALYIQPLADRLRSGWARDGAPSHLFLLVDLKQPDDRLVLAVLDELAPISDNLTRVAENRVVPGRVTVVLSGRTPRGFVAGLPERVVFIDGRPTDLDRRSDRELVPLISENWNRLVGPTLPVIGSPEDRRLREIVGEAHRQGRLVRSWAAPDSVESWEYQRMIGVDLINTDRPGAFSAFWSDRP